MHALPLCCVSIYTSTRSTNSAAAAAATAAATAIAATTAAPPSAAAAATAAATIDYFLALWFGCIGSSKLSADFHPSVQTTPALAQELCNKQ